MLTPGDGTRHVSDTQRSLNSGDGGTPESAPDGSNSFLERANRTISRDGSTPDPFADGGLAPNRPFGPHSRISSVEFIASIVEEKSDSLLNKAITSVSYL